MLFFYYKGAVVYKAEMAIFMAALELRMRETTTTSAARWFGPKVADFWQKGAQFVAQFFRAKLPPKNNFYCSFM